MLLRRFLFYMVGVEVMVLLFSLITLILQTASCTAFEFADKSVDFCECLFRVSNLELRFENVFGKRFHKLRPSLIPFEYLMSIAHYSFEALIEN